MPPSPFPASTSSPGQGQLTTVLLPNGHSHISSLTYQYPLKLISPPRNPQQHLAALVFLLSYGGGLVGGDTVSLAITVQPHAKLAIVTQGHTKIFKSAAPDIVTRQTLHVRIQDGAALCLLPDPVQPFAESVYEQTQLFQLQGPRASLCLLDWVTQGRSARGEDWDLVRWTGRNEIWLSTSSSTSTSSISGGGAADADTTITGAGAAKAKGEGRLLVRDAVKLDGTASSLRSSPAVKHLRDTMHGMGIFGTLVLRGPLVQALGAFFLAEFAAMPRIGARDWRSDEARKAQEAQRQQNEGPRTSDALEDWRAARLKLEQDEQILWSAANVRGCVVVKFGSCTVEGGRMWIGTMLTRQGSIAEHFGDQALMCVK